MNAKSISVEIKISRLLEAISKPARLQILLAIGAGEACVCHLETLLGMRQAYISQHLMAMRKARILSARRSGRYIFYRLRNPELLSFIRQAGQLAGVPGDQLDALIHPDPLPHCECPKCAAVELMHPVETAQPTLHLTAD